MTIFRLNQDYFEILTLEANPSRTFISSSVGGVTGAIYLFAERSPIAKASQKLATFEDRVYDDDNVENMRLNIKNMIIKNRVDGIPQASYVDSMDEYLEKVNAQSISQRQLKQAKIIRFTPSTRFTSDTLRKNAIKDTVFPYYQPAYPTLHWAYTNYHSLNFFTSSQVPSASCLIYPAASASISSTSTNKLYLPSSSFTFDFYVNPRYTTDVDTQEFHAGTIFHMSSSYAISLVSGSSSGPNGTPDAFRIMLQLSHSAEIAPSLISLTGTNNQRPIDDAYPNVGDGKGDLIFLSTDNSLKLNHWHHVGIRWGTTVQDGSGSIIIDGSENATFVIPSGTCMPSTFNDPVGDPDALFIGNFYDNPNDSDYGALTSMFFNANAAQSEGVVNLFGTDTGIGDPQMTTGRSFAHPLNAEIHNLKIYDHYRSDNQLLSSSATGSNTISDGLLLYVPPFFVPESRDRDVLQTPFQATSSMTTDDPFNVALSFGVGGHLLNLENFCREFVEKKYPRLYNLTASETTSQTNTAFSANHFLFSTGSIRKRNLTAIPCDNGRVIPAFDLLASGTYYSKPPSGSLTYKYRNDLGFLDYSMISLRNLVPTSSLQTGLFQYAVESTVFKEDTEVSTLSALDSGRGYANPRLFETHEVTEEIWVEDENGQGTYQWVTRAVPNQDSDTGKLILKDQIFNEETGDVVDSGRAYPDAVGTGSIVSAVAGATPESPGVAPGVVLSIFQRTRDNSSDEVVFFDISNLFYGDKIMPTSLSIKDIAVTGSGGKVKMTLRDDGKGNLYRGDCLTKQATWNSVGNVLYHEGIVIVKSPNIPFFGKEEHEVKLKGVRNLHILEINIPCPQGTVNSSSNPAYKSLKPNSYASTKVNEFVYITGINFHDDNFNIIGRTNLAQPVVKRNEDEFNFRVKIDF